MKILQVLLFCVSLFIFAGCTSYGKKYAADKDHEVYYKGDGVDEANAKKLADYLKEQGYFTDNHQATVQIVKTKDSFNLNFVYDKAQVNAEREAKFLIFGGAISRDVFNSAPVNIHLCDDKLETFKDLGYAKP
jgi:tRNA U34 5-methylaminomethyl-2-thiouridine-forming methyltransferase MnmC